MHRPSAVPTKRNAMRPPANNSRPTSGRTLSTAHPPSGRVSPAESVSSMVSRQRSPAQNASLKRKEREFELDAGEETNINVVVRCRGRNEREVRENSGVVVSTDGVKGKAVELSMGPNALSNKTYHFDKVFSSAADQIMVFDEVVTPILDEVLTGFNCTVFAYGQTGTGKTYTMSGDITDVLPLPDSAGIIPRVLYSLFDKLEKEGTEANVKCSFIELYNEELRDLLALDESVKLKIYDDAGKQGRSTTLVQGMEEFNIKTASKGLQLLREGSHKRQVAATKCNDLSSRSHTIFTVTVHMKRFSETGEELVSIGKLNLVDLAGSENIQRSGAENKRAAEAGLINKSLLTLGRVINALVDKSSHIPYRESKLTRLLQDSLGGRTKTCIIATLSPAKSNLEETISTLDYAFRAKNIRNKPQMNHLMSKKALITEYTAEIEKLKSELIATRQRNGVYLATEHYEEITTESESRRILSEEQRDKILTMEANLRNKSQELFQLTTTFNDLKKNNEAVKEALRGTQDVLERTDLILSHTKQRLSEETMLREAHQSTEEELARVGGDLLSTLSQTTKDIGGLHSKLRRRSDLQTLNRNKWTSSQSHVCDTTKLVQERMKVFEAQHEEMMSNLSTKTANYLEQELQKLSQSKSFLESKVSEFEKAEAEVNSQTEMARDDMNSILGEIATLKQEVKQKVGEGLDGLSVAAKRISNGVLTELESFHTQLHTSYSTLGKDFKHTFDDLVKQLNYQREEADDLRKELQKAEEELIKANENTSTQLNRILTEEKDRAAKDRASLLTQITSLVQSHGEAQDRRIDSSVSSMQAEIRLSNQRFGEEFHAYQSSMDAWSIKDRSIVEEILKSRESVKLKIKKDWTAANERNGAIQCTTQAVHQETVGIVDAQMKHLDVQLLALDEILSKVREQNTKHHDAHVGSLSGLADTVKASYASIGDNLDASSNRGREFERTLVDCAQSVSATLEPLDEDVHACLSRLREDISSAPIAEYAHTGETPQKVQYQFTSSLPRTDHHETLLKGFRNEPTHKIDVSPSKTQTFSSPSKTKIFADAETNDYPPLPDSPTITKKSSRLDNYQGGLRELDANVGTVSTKADSGPLSSIVNDKAISSVQPPMKRQNTNIVTLASNTPPEDRLAKVFSASMGSKHPRRAVQEGRENMPFSASVGVGGRTLRSRGS